MPLHLQLLNCLKRVIYGGFDLLAHSLFVYQERICNHLEYFRLRPWPRNLRTGTPPKLFRTILCFVALVYN